MENFNQDKDLYVTIFTELKALGVKVPKLKKFKSNLSKQEISTPKKSCKTFGVSLSEQEWMSDGDYPVPKFIALVTDYLQKYMNEEVGLFRKAGNFVRQRRLREKIENGEDIGNSDPNDVAALLKKWLRELPEPLIPSYLQDLFIRCQTLSTEKDRMSACLLACHLLPPDHLNTLKHLLRFFAAVAFNSEKNKMGTYNLAVILAPNIFASHEPVQRSKNTLVFQHAGVIKILVENSDKIGEMPPSLLVSESSLLATESRHSVDDLEINTSKFRKRISGVQDIFSGFRKLVAVTPKNASADELCIASPRQAISLDDLDGSYDSTQTKATEKKKSGHARRKSFGALFLRKKDKKKFDKNNHAEPISLSLETISLGEIGKTSMVDYTKNKFNHNLSYSFSVKEKSKSKITEVFQPASKPLTIAPTRSDSISFIKKKRSTKWHVENISENVDPLSFENQASSKVPVELPTSNKLGLSRQEAFIFKSNKVKPLNPVTEVKSLDNNSEPPNILCQHSESFCNLKCDKNKCTVPEKELSQESECTVAEEESSRRKNVPPNLEKEMSKIKYKRSVPERKPSLDKADETRLKHRPSSLKIKHKSEILSQKVMSHSLRKSSSATIARPPLSKFSKSAQKSEEPLVERNCPQSLDLSLSLLLHNFCLSPPKESPELQVNIDITSTNSNPELRVSLRNKPHKETVEKQRVSQRLHQIPENESSEEKSRKRLSSSSDSRIPRLKRLPDPQRPSSFSGRLSEFKPALKKQYSQDESSKRHSTRIPVFLVENCSPKVVEEERKLSDSVYQTPDSSFCKDTSVSWMSGSKYLSALSTPDEEMTNKRESIARILKYNEGHVQAKVSMFDQPGTSNGNIDKLLSEGKMVRASSEKYPSGTRYNRAKLTTSNSYDSVNKKDSVKFRSEIQKSNLLNSSKINLTTQSTLTSKRSSSLDRPKTNSTHIENSSPTLNFPK